VRGRLAAGRDAFDVLEACFPAGTLSGAPKIRAMEIIEELEPTRRGPYGGAVGYISYSGNLDSCITIRTVVCHGGKASIQVGAGLVADSDPKTGGVETRSKAQGMILALRGSPQRGGRQPLLFVLHNNDSFTYNLVQYLGELGASMKVARNDKITVDEVERLELEGIVISPGPGTPEDGGISLDLVRRFHARTPILGVCLGHQTIGQAFGG